MRKNHHGAKADITTRQASGKQRLPETRKFARRVLYATILAAATISTGTTAFHAGGSMSASAQVFASGLPSGSPLGHRAYSSAESEPVFPVPESTAPGRLASGWRVNPRGEWVTEGIQIHIESPDHEEPQSTVLCGQPFGFILAFGQIDPDSSDSNGGDPQAAPARLRIKSGNRNTRLFDFLRRTRHGVTHFIPIDATGLERYLRGEPSFRIEYPLHTGWATHLYDHRGVDSTPCRAPDVRSGDSPA